MNPSKTPPAIPVEHNIQSALEWLAEANRRSSPEHAEQLHRQMQLVRAAPLPTSQRSKILDLFYTHTARLVETEIPDLQQITMPISRRLRLRVRVLQNLLETLAQDYLNTLSDLFDPQLTQPHRPPAEALRHIIQCLVWNIRVSQLIAAPTPVGLWLELHTILGTIRRLGCEKSLTDEQQSSMEHLYLSAILIAIAQPTSFNSRELEFIASCLDSLSHDIHLSESPPLDSNGAFWIDPQVDFPAHAIVRRPPPPDIHAWFFSCKDFAGKISGLLKLLVKGTPAASIGLPAMADTVSGQNILRRLVTRWGDPGKRRFNRRRQSYRARMAFGLNHLWQLFKTPETPPPFSEWMVINESPDGYAIMHMSGEASELAVGDIVAIQPGKDAAKSESPWYICIVRWAVSENPEHIELGLQLLAAKAMAASIGQAHGKPAQTINALLIPETPPLRNTPAVIVESGKLSSTSEKIIVLLEKENLEIREVRPTHLDEQTSLIDVFSVEPDETN